MEFWNPLFPIFWPGKLLRRYFFLTIVFPLPKNFFLFIHADNFDRELYKELVIEVFFPTFVNEKNVPYVLLPFCFRKILKTEHCTASHNAYYGPTASNSILYSNTIHFLTVCEFGSLLNEINFLAFKFCFLFMTCNVLQSFKFLPKRPTLQYTWFITEDYDEQLDLGFYTLTFEKKKN